MMLINGDIDEDDDRVVFDPFFRKASCHWQQQQKDIKSQLGQAISWIKIVSRINQVIPTKLINLIEIISSLPKRQKHQSLTQVAFTTLLTKSSYSFRQMRFSDSENYPHYPLKLDNAK